MSMDPDDLKQVWQTPAAPGRVTIDAAMLVNEVRRSERLFRAMIFWRDVREVGIALVMVPVWIRLGLYGRTPWTWYLMVPVLIWISGFMIVDRLRHRPRQADAGESLATRVGSSLAEIEHQIWLLKNVFWWGLLQMIVPIVMFLTQSMLNETGVTFVAWIGIA